MPNQVRLNSSGKKAIFLLYRWVFVQVLILFLAAGRMTWPRGWLYCGIMLLSATVSALVMWKVIPELANQRSDYGQDTKPWDRVLLPLFMLLSIVAIPLVSGLDAGRFHWSELPFAVSLAGIGLYVLSIALNLTAMIVNKHFEGSARIQKERNHQVISSGPYSVVRHPGYLAMILSTLAMPVIIGSGYGLIAAGAVAVVVIIRTAFEDRMLREELTGYAGYAERVKYRLLPGIW